MKESKQDYLYSSKIKVADNINLISYSVISITLLIIILIIWASFTKIKEVSVTQGSIEPKGSILTVQHFDGGMVKSINVNEGDVVKKGQLLLELIDMGIDEELNKAQIAQLNHEMHAKRLKCLINQTSFNLNEYQKKYPALVNKQFKLFNDEIDARNTQKRVLEDELAQQVHLYHSDIVNKENLEKQLPISKQIYESYKKGSDVGVIPKLKFLEEHKNYIDMEGKYDILLKNIEQLSKQIDEYKSKIISFEATYADKLNHELEQIDDQLMQNAEHIKALELKKERLKLYSEYDGIVKDVNVNSIGQVVHPGDTILEIVPLNKPIIANVKILPTDVGHISIGNSARVKISSYDYTRYGYVQGTIYHISPSTFTDKDGKSYYKGLVKLDKNYVGNNPLKNIIIPGMIVQAEIITGEKSIISYLLKPIYIALTSALTER